MWDASGYEQIEPLFDSPQSLFGDGSSSSTRLPSHSPNDSPTGSIDTSSDPSRTDSRSDDRTGETPPIIVYPADEH